MDKLKFEKLLVFTAAVFFVSPMVSAYEPPQITQVSDSIRGPMNLTENSPIGQISETQGIPTEVDVSDRETKVVTDKDGIEYEICVNEVEHAEGTELEYRYYKNTPPVEPDEAWTEERCYNTKLKWEGLATEVHIQVRDDRESPVEELETFNVNIYYYNLVNPDLESDEARSTTEYDTVIIPKDEYDRLKNNQRDTEQLEEQLEEKERKIRGLENKVERLADEIDEQSSQEEQQLENREEEKEIEPEAEPAETESELSEESNEKKSNRSFVARIIGSIF